MAILKQQVQVEVLGTKELDIPVRGDVKARFYKVNGINTIENEDYFSFTIVGETDEEDREILVTFDTPLIINGEMLKAKETQVDERMVEELYYHMAHHYMSGEDLESGMIALACTGDVGAYQRLAFYKNLDEKQLGLIRLEDLIKNPSKRYEKGKVPIQVAISKASLCLVELLQMIREDKESKLLWKYETPYSYIQMKNKMIDENYEFIYPESGYGVITQVTIGSKKLNLGVTTKVEGLVEEKDTGLKIGAAVCREYAIVVNGKLNIDTLWCELSQPLLKRLRKEKILKKPVHLRTKTIYGIDLRKLHITREHVLKWMTQQEIVKALYEIQVMGCKERVLKKILVDLEKEEMAETCTLLIEEARQLRKRFQIDEKGIYTPFQIEKRDDLPYKVYPATILEWKIEKFPAKKIEKEIWNDYERALEGEEDKRKWINQMMKGIHRDKKELKDRVNTIRIASALLGKELFMWEEISIKEKVETDKLLEMNAVIGGKIEISTKKIDDMILRQDRYTVLTRCTE